MNIIWENFFQKTKKIIGSLSPALWAVLLVATIGIIILFVPPINGLADNGDYFLVLDANNLYIQNPTDYSYNEYFQNLYGIRQYYNQRPSGFLSTNQIFITLAIWLNRVFFSQELFDIRFLAVTYLVALLPAIYLLTRGLTFGMSKKRGYLLAVIVSFVFGDGTYLIYFNSFYTEAVAYIGFLYILAIIYYFFRVKENPFFFFSSIFVATFFFIGAHRQYYSMIIGLILMGLGLLFYVTKRVHKILLLGALGSILLGIGAVVSLNDSMTYNRDLYHAINRGVLLNDDQAEEPLLLGGINPQYSLLAGTTYYDEYSPVPLAGQTIAENLLEDTGNFWILVTYFSQGEQFLDLWKLGIQDMYLVKPNELGNYLKQDGKEAAEKANFFTLDSKIKAAIFPKTVGFFIVLALVFMGIYGIGFYRGLTTGETWLCFRFFVVLGLLASFFATFFTAIIFQGDADYTRHLFLSSVILDSLIVLLISDSLGNRLWSDKERFVK